MEPPTENPQRAGADWPAAVVAGAFRTGVLGVRTLVRRGVRAVSFDCDPRYANARSPYGRARTCPNPDTHPTEWVSFMTGLSASLGGRPALIASSDQFVTAIASHREALAGHYTLSPGVPLQGSLATKETQYELAATHGMPMPRTSLGTQLTEVATFAASARFPCLMKPFHFRHWQQLPHDHPFYDMKVAIARTPAELIHNWNMVSPFHPRVILQEIIEGPDSAKRVYLSCYSTTGRRLGHALFRELRCLPLGFGPATVTEPVVDPQTDGICDRFLRAIGYSGICEIEMKYDQRDGRVKLIEVNPRLSGGGDAAPHAGVDLCWLHYLDLIGVDTTPVGPDGRDFRHIVLRADVPAIAAYRREGMLAWSDLVRSYRPPLAFFDFDIRDWRYSAETLYRVARSLAGVLLRGFARWKAQASTASLPKSRPGE